jgi:hypothetical protein
LSAKNHTPTSRSALLATIVGGLLGVWTAGWWIGAAASIERGWLFRGLSIPQPKLVTLFVPPSGVLRETWRSLRVPLPADPLPLMLSLSASGALVMLIALFAIRLLRIDESGYGVRAIRWAARSCCSRPHLFVIVVAPASVIVAAILLSADAFARLALGLGVVFVAWCASCTVVLCRPAVVANELAGAWWRSPFPPRRVILGCVGITVLSYVVPIAIELPPVQRVFGVVVTTALSTGAQLLLGFLAVAICVTESLQPLRNKRMARWSTFSPWLMIHLLLGLAMVALTGPLTATAFIYWKIAPFVAAQYAALGLPLPWAWSLAFHVVQFVEQYWWLLLGYSALFAYTLAAGKVVWHSLTSEQEPRSSQ